MKNLKITLTIWLVWLLALTSLAQETQTVTLEVPAGLNSSPFNVARTLKIPTGFKISVYARVGGARFMALTPNGEVLVSNPGSGKIFLVKKNGTSNPLVTEFATGLNKPHDMVFHKIGTTTYLYIAEADKIRRAVYTLGDQTLQNSSIIIANLPSNSTPELQGKYGHELKNIALDKNHKLYVSIASTCNACTEDTESNPIRGSVYIYNADGTGARLFAQGIRNAEGLDMIPGSDSLWVVVNNRDNIAYPFHNDFDGDQTDDYGKVLNGYVNNNPPEEFTYVKDGGNYGWPFCNPDPFTTNGYNNMPFNRDVQLNADGSKLNCDNADRITKGIQAHSAPLGLSFIINNNFPDPFKYGAYIGCHGSWNRDTPAGYKVLFFPFNSNNMPGNEFELVSGFSGSTYNSVWGRPVDVIADANGDILISDDAAGAIYRLSYIGAPIFAGDYHLKAKHSNKLLDVSGVSVANGADVIQWPANGGSNQIWTLQSTGGGFYKLTAKHSGKVLDVQYSNLSDGGKVWQWEDNGTDAQRWKIEPVEAGYYRLVSKASGKALEVAGDNNQANGALVQQSAYLGNDDQKWAIVNTTTTSRLSGQGLTDEAGGGVSLYPNPATKNVTVAYEEGISKVQLINAYNVLASQTSVNDTKTIIDLSSIPAGLYIIKVTTLKGGVYNLKLLVE